MKIVLTVLIYSASPFPAEYIPVSYTHLVIFAAFSCQFLSIPLFAQQQKVDTTHTYSIPEITVDVYKRQVYTGRREPRAELHDFADLAAQSRRAAMR